MVAQNSNFHESVEKRQKSIEKALLAAKEVMGKTLESEGLDLNQFTPTLFLRDDLLQQAHRMFPQERRTQVMATISRWLTTELDELNGINDEIKLMKAGLPELVGDLIKSVKPKDN